MTAGDIEGWDSHQHVLLIVAIENRFGIKMKTREIDELKCVGDMIKVVQAKICVC
jgi:acyl carrier protein